MRAPDQSTRSWERHLEVVEQVMVDADPHDQDQPVFEERNKKIESGGITGADKGLKKEINMCCTT